MPGATDTMQQDKRSTLSSNMRGRCCCVVDRGEKARHSQVRYVLTADADSFFSWSRSAVFNTFPEGVIGKLEVKKIDFGTL